MEESKKKTVLILSLLTAGVGVLLAGLKVAAGVLGGSQAMVSDAVHSVSDVISSLIVILSALFIKKESDEKAKRQNAVVSSVFSFILVAFLLYTVFDIIFDAVKSIVDHSYADAGLPDAFSFIVAGVSVAVKETLFQVTVSRAKKIDYPPLSANAWHQRADALTSVGTLLSLGLNALFSFKLADPIIALLIALYILHVAVDITLTATEKLSGKPCHHHHKHDCDVCVPSPVAFHTENEKEES